METRIKKLLSMLDFEGCIKLFNQSPRVLAMDMLIFDRMEELDEERFDRFLDGKEG